jgi:cell wall-associated NlpC family hydrolase
MKIDLFQKFMLSFLNIPYLYGGKNPLTGEDCSGLVCEFLKALGALGTNDELNSQGLYQKFKPMTKTTAGAPMVGALVFYGTDVSQIDHVAMFIDDNFIVEAGHGTADTLSKDIAAQRGAFVRIRPYQYRADFLEILYFDLGLTP